MTTSETNKEIVRRFNKEFIEQGNEDVFNELIAPDFIHCTAPQGAAKGPNGLLHFFKEYLKPVLPNLKVEIYNQIAEGDMVSTYKAFHATQSGGPLELKPGERIAIEVVEITRLRAGTIVEQWNVMDLQPVLVQVRERAGDVY